MENKCCKTTYTRIDRDFWTPEGSALLHLIGQVKEALEYDLARQWGVGRCHSHPAFLPDDRSCRCELYSSRAERASIVQHNRGVCICGDMRVANHNHHK